MDTWIASGEYRTALSLSRLNVKEEESGVDTWTILGDAWMSYLTEPTALTSIEARYPSRDRKPPDRYTYTS